MAGKEVKRGRLRRVTIKHMYDEDGAPSGHTVTAEHEPDASTGDGKGYTPYPPDIETPHETHDSALAKAKEHYESNMARFGKKGKKISVPEGPAQAALGRKS